MQKLTMHILIIIFYSVFSLATLSCNNSEESATDPSEIITQLEKINLPDGFEISVYASDIDNARSMAMSPSGVLYVGNRSGNKVFALKDSNGDFKVDQKFELVSGLTMPNGVAFHNGDLYIAEVNRILKISQVENDLSNPASPEVVFEDLPSDRHHGWKYIAFGPDGKLYVPVGAPCNICNREEPIYATINRMNPDGSDFEIFAKGVRNSVGFTWHPETKNLWFTDNGRDMLGDDVPPCELNRATEAGQHFGYPFCHGGTIKDPEFGNQGECSEFTSPAQPLGPHVAPLGLKFNTGNMFPNQYKNQLFIAEHGSWNRSKKIGYRISLVKMEGENVTSYETFADGWLDEDSQSAWGRPVDILFLPDGSMLVSDDSANMIYRISYNG